MKIGVDVSPLCAPLAGVGHYILQLLEPMIQRQPQIDWILFSPGRSESIEQLLGYPSVQLLAPSQRIKDPLQQQMALQLLAALHPVDHFWATNHLLLPLVRAQRKVITIHDFNYRICPETMPRRRQVYCSLLARRSIQQADRIATNSHGTAQWLQHYYGRKADAIIPPLLRPIFQPLGGSRDYLVTVATLEPRKNLELLLRSYLQTIRKYGPAACLPLVLIGGRGWKDSSLMRTIRDAMAHYPELIRLTGYVTDEQLVTHLSGARAFILPSRYEGYGMPIAEARACGTPIIATDLPEMREAAQGDGLFLPLDQLEEQLTPHFLRESPIRQVGPVNYPTVDQLSMRMSELLCAST
jgi:glycosyltransferase involved in cell wall biosynthesis